MLQGHVGEGWFRCRVLPALLAAVCRGPTGPTQPSAHNDTWGQEHGTGVPGCISVSSYQPSLCQALHCEHGCHGGQTYCFPRIGSEVTGPEWGPDSIPKLCGCGQVTDLLSCPFFVCEVGFSSGHLLGCWEKLMKSSW